MRGRYLLGALSSIVSAGILSCSAAAQGNSWTGVYVGGGIGADAVTADGEASGFGARASASGLAGGDFGATMTIGADYQLNQTFVAGVFASYDWSAIDVSGSATAGGSTASGHLLSIDRNWTIGLRGGVLLTPDTLAYGLVGYTEAKLSGITATAPGFSFNYNPPTYRAVTIGGGLEHRVTENLSLRAEYRYADFGRDRDFSAFGVNVESDKQLHVARLIAAYRLGGSASASTKDGATTQPTSYNWAGLHVGAGLGFSGISGEGAVQAPGIGSAEGSGIVGANVAGTASVGYDFEVGSNWIVGPVAYYDFNAYDETVRVSTAGLSAAADILSVENSWMIGIRGGYKLSPDSVVYAVAGYTEAEFSDIAVTATDGVNTLSAKLGLPTFAGYTLGGGFEKQFGSNLALSAEYRYSNYDRKSVFNIARTINVDADPESHAVRLMIKYRQ